jgi:hypothetical protein
MARTSRILVGAASLGLLAGLAEATPSTTYWTPMTVDIQSYGVLHIGVDNYFTVGKKLENGGGGFPTDAGLTLGVLPSTKVQAEVGFDLFGPADYPLVFNAKLGTPEGTLFKGSPTLQAGICNVGTKKGVTDQNVVYGVVGKAFPKIGRLSAGPYIGNASVLRDSEGNKANSGFMVAFDRSFAPTKDKEGTEFSRVVFAADYASGKNAFGAGGFGLYYFFRSNISLLVGPVFFNDQGINGKTKWTIQLDINHPRLFGK